MFTFIQTDKLCTSTHVGTDFKDVFPLQIESSAKQPIRTSPSSQGDAWHRAMLRDWDSMDGREQSRLKSRLGGILLDEYAAQKKSTGSDKVGFRVQGLSLKGCNLLRSFSGKQRFYL